MSNDYLVALECGHWFAESRPNKYEIDPLQKRACGVPGHFPQQYPAVYFSADQFEWPDGTYTVSRVDNTPEPEDIQ